jgi:predicted nucleic acid-binding protein
LPLIENDLIFAYLNELDPNFKVAEKTFRKLDSGAIRVSISSAALIEMELIYRSENKEDALLKDMAALAALPNTTFEPLTPDIALSAVYLRQTFGLGLFDSHYAATALSLDRTVVSFDRAYENVKGLRRLDPARV